MLGNTENGSDTAETRLNCCTVLLIHATNKHQLQKHTEHTELKTMKESDNFRDLGVDRIILGWI
jgi:hypothetical protein